jgi:hypothetical protein
MTPSATALFAGTPAVGDLDQAFLFLTVAESAERWDRTDRLLGLLDGMVSR